MPVNYHHPNHIRITLVLPWVNLGRYYDIKDLFEDDIYDIRELKMLALSGFGQK